MPADLSPADLAAALDLARTILDYDGAYRMTMADALGLARAVLALDERVQSEHQRAAEREDAPQQRERPMPADSMDPAVALEAARRKMTLRDWHLRLQQDEADAVRNRLDELEATVARLRSALAFAADRFRDIRVSVAVAQTPSALIERAARDAEQAMRTAAVTSEKP